MGWRYMCHHIPTDEREAFAEKWRESAVEFDDASEEPSEATDQEPEERPEPMPTSTDD